MYIQLPLVLLLAFFTLACKCGAMEENGVEANDDCNDAMNDCLTNEKCRRRLQKYVILFLYLIFLFGSISGIILRAFQRFHFI